MTTNRIERLTPEQEAMLPVTRDKWLTIGLSTEPGDHAVAEQAIRDAYHVAGLEPPSLVLWLSSPLHGAVAGAMLASEPKKFAQVRAQVGDQVGAQVRAQVGDQVWDQVGAQVGAQVRDQVWDQVWDQVGDQVWDQVGAQVRDQVGAQVRAQVRDQVWDQVWAQVGAQVRAQVGAQVYRAGYGLHDAAWLSFYEFFLSQCGLEACAKLLPLMQLAQHSGWWWSFKSVCIATEKPSALHCDEQGRLHNDTGPALDYGGTWGIWAFHGVRVPAMVIEHPEDITAPQVLAERNAEVARVMLDRMGIERFCRDADSTVLHSDIDGAGQPRRLLSIPMPNDPDRVVVVVEVTCPSTGHHYLLRVPPTMRTCTAAVAWTFNVEVKDYAPVAEA